MTKQTAAIHLTLLVAVLFSTWLCLKLPVGEQQPDNRVDRKMDAFMSNTSYTQTDSHGEIQTQVSAVSIEHFPLQNTSIFHHPDITLYNQRPGNPSQPWHITADQGVAESGLHKIRLQDNVKIEQYQPAHHYTMTLFTQILDIFPTQKIIETKEQITLLQPGTVIKSIGLKVDIQQGTLQFLSKAFAHFKAFNGA